MMNGSAVETAAPAPPARAWARLVATFLGAGYLRPGPGTWGSLGALALWLPIAYLLPAGWRPAGALALALAALVAGIPAATRVARALGKEDPSCVVIDEACGQWLAVVGSPLHWKSLLAAFILFRAFDIVKPPPVRQLESLPAGTGIMLDDVGAGLYALLIMQLLLHFGVLN